MRMVSAFVLIVPNRLRVEMVATPEQSRLASHR